MKMRIVLLLILMSGVGCVTSCSNDDDASIQVESLAGIWNLKNVRGGLQGIDIDYTVGQVQWNFNTNTLIIENNIATTGPEDIYAGLDSGTYNFTVMENGGVRTLFIDNVERGVLDVSENNLKIDDGLEVDGFITEFER